MSLTVTMLTKAINIDAVNVCLRIRRSSSGVSIYYYIAQKGPAG